MTIDFIPIHQYNNIFFHIVLFFTLATILHLFSNKITDIRNLTYIKIAGILLLLIVLLYMGLRPIHIVFIDMPGYYRIFTFYAEGNPIVSTKDYLFHLFMMLSSRIMTAHQFFLSCTIIYVIPLYFASKKWFKQYWFYAFLMLVGSFSFWAYGVNGIRNGIATSLLLLAISREKLIWKIFWIVLAVGFHASVLLPALGFAITWFYNKPKVYLYFWFTSIILSLAFPGFWENLFAGTFEDERVSYLITEADPNRFSSTGFRWDFLLYSATGVFAGWYYLFKKYFGDKVYIQIFNTYLITNAFWILVIRANYSNRFAYLSWFMLAIIIIFPWLKKNYIENREFKLAWIILSYYMFTYMMNIIL